MKKFFNKARDTARENLRNISIEDSGTQRPDGPDSVRAPHVAASLEPPTAEDVVRYRYHNGTNLGSIFGISSLFLRGFLPLIYDLPRYLFTFTSDLLISNDDEKQLAVS